LTGSTTWVEYDGTHIIRKVWNGRANLGELEVDGPGRSVLVREIYSPLGANSRRLEIAYSDDGGKNWETYWIMTDTRMGDEAGKTH
jgi:hypothetical protein